MIDTQLLLGISEDLILMAVNQTDVDIRCRNEQKCSQYRENAIKRKLG